MTQARPKRYDANLIVIGAGSAGLISALIAATVRAKVTLIERGKTGRGTRLDVSMLESMVEWMSFPLYYAYRGASPPPRAAAANATIYTYGPFATASPVQRTFSFGRYTNPSPRVCAHPRK